MNKRYEISEWGVYGGGVVATTDDLEEAKRIATELLDAVDRCGIISVYDNKLKRNIHRDG